MEFSRRRFLSSVAMAALLLSARQAGAWPRHGAVSYPIGTGWNVLPLGCGGLVTGMNIANDGTMVCRTDVGNIYRWSGTPADYTDPTKTWVPLLNFTSLGSSAKVGSSIGGWEHVLAPNHSTVHAAIFDAMVADGQLGALWYSTNSGGTWTKSDLLFQNSTVHPNGVIYGYTKQAQQKVAIDPANPNIAYCGMPYNSGNTGGAWTTLNKSGGSSLGTWTSVKSSGSTPLSNCTNGLSAGVAFDFTSGTTTIGGQTVTNRIIIPVGGVGIYESTDGGNTFSEVAASQIGTGDFFVPSGGFTADGYYYCVVVHYAYGGVYRYKSGTWTNIISGSGYSPSDYGMTTFLIIDPRNNSTSKAYLSVSGVNGIGMGFTSQNANGVSPTWTGATSGQAPFLKSTSYDLEWINTIFGQGPGGFAGMTGAWIDPNGGCWAPGNQSIFYFGSSDTSATRTTSGGPIYQTGGSVRATGNTSGLSTNVTFSGVTGTISVGQTVTATGLPDGITILSQSSGTPGGAGVYVMSAAATLTSADCYLDAFRTYLWSMGRGTEVTVSQDALCPPGGTYPVMATQDLGTPMRGTFTTYPTEQYVDFVEYTCENLEYAASDSSFVVARVTGQGGSFDDVSGYSTNYGANGSWTRFSGNPTSLWQAQTTASISNGSGGAGDILNVTAVVSGGTIFPYSLVSLSSTGSAEYGYVQPYGTGSTTGTGNTGTYKVANVNGVPISSNVASTTIYCVTPIQGGQTVAVDHDHMVTIPAGYYVITIGNFLIPAYTTDRGATWALCSGLPALGWISRPWVYGPTCKPFAVGYGADLNTVWACGRSGTTMYLFRSTDKGASFGSAPDPFDNAIASWATSESCEGFYCLSVPGYPGELWVSGSFTGGYDAELWHITNANTSSATATVVARESAGQVPRILTLGAPATPGGYPTIYLQGRVGGDPNAPFYLYEGQWSGSSMTWSLFGPTGSIQDLPPVSQLLGIQSLRGDWNVYRRLYLASGSAGFAYYNPP